MEKIDGEPLNIDQRLVQRIPFTLNLSVILRKFTIIHIVILILMSAANCFGAQITLRWDSNPEPNVAGYRIYYGLASRNYMISIDVGMASTATVYLLKDDATHYIAATAYDINGNESDFSEELRYPDESSDASGASSVNESGTGGGGMSYPDSDNDGIDDLSEQLFWGETAQVDLDADGLINTEDPDADNDGVLDGVEILNRTDPADPRAYPSTVYEDAEDDLTLGWGVYDGPTQGVIFSNIYDEERQGRVIDIFRDGTQGVSLRMADGSQWLNSDQFVISWRMKHAGLIYVVVETTIGPVHLQYAPRNDDRLLIRGVIEHGIGAEAGDGQWHVFVRDLQADFRDVFPDESLLSVLEFKFRGNARFDDIQLMQPDWDGDRDGLSDFDEVNLHRTDPDAMDTDGDGINDGDELNIYGTAAGVADSDGDGWSDGEELAFWDTGWNLDTDGDGRYNLVDADADNDGHLDGDEIVNRTDPADPRAYPATVYEDAEDGSTLGWGVYDGLSQGVIFSNVYDEERQGLVIDIFRDGTQGVRLRMEDGSQWRNPDQFVISWRMKHAGLIYVVVETTIGPVHLQYAPRNDDRLLISGVIEHGIGAEAGDGQWHVFVRDLQADFRDVYPDESLLAVLEFKFRGNARFDDIQLMQRDWDGDRDGLSDFDEANLHRTDPDAMDTDGDEVKDGDEVMVYGTDPVLTNTDVENEDASNDSKVSQVLDPPDLLSTSPTVYEDAEDGSTLGWGLYDGPWLGVTLSNVFDEGRQSRVIDIFRDGTQGVRLRMADGSQWLNPDQFVISWRMKHAGLIYVVVDTTIGPVHLQYAPRDDDRLLIRGVIEHGIGVEAGDGQWHVFVRDLQADFREVYPDESLLAVLEFKFRGNARFDDIQLMQRDWDGDRDGLTDFDEANLHHTDPDVMDTDGDGIDDGDELYFYGTDPDVTDSDGDGWDDGEEILFYGTDPTKPDALNP